MGAGASTLATLAIYTIAVLLPAGIIATGLLWRKARFATGHLPVLLFALSLPAPRIPWGLFVLQWRTNAWGP